MQSSDKLPVESSKAPQAVKLVLMGPRPDLLKRLIHTIFGETAPHIGVLVEDRWLYHIMPSRRQGHTVSRHDLHSRKFVGRVIAISEALVGPGHATLEQLCVEFDGMRYNRPLFFWMFLRGFVQNRLGCSLSSKWLTRDDRVMCADLVSRFFYGTDLSGELTPERIYERVTSDFGKQPLACRAHEDACDALGHYAMSR